MKKILIIGAKGQLGNEFQALASQYANCHFYFYDKEELDIVHEADVYKTIESLQPDFLVNCAAYTAVDKAETDQQLAYAINADAVKYLATACTKNNVKFIHVSTDYVFDGTASKPYQEEGATNPNNIYGQSKLQGEANALKYNPECIIIRTAWVYSVYGHNFVKTMLRLMQSKPELNVVADQYGSPTLAADLAEAIMQIIESQKWALGIYHFTNDGVITWFDFAKEIARLSNASCIVNPIATEQYPTPAKRPQYSVLNKTKIQQTFGIQLKDWKESLQQCIAKMPL